VIGEAIATLRTDPTDSEIIVVDGGSQDQTARIVRGFGEPVYLIAQNPNGPRGRAAAYNQAARNARGQVLVFLHADTRLPKDGLAMIEAVLSDPKVIGGGFLPSFDTLGQRPRGFALTMVERGWALRTRRFRWFAGDQSPFIRREVFEACGGYPPVRLAEDWAFASRLRRLGPLAVIDEPVRVNARRHLANGVLKTLVVTGSVELFYRFGVNPGFLSWWYRRWLPRERG
jgi:glycosyltransferase involved in cell wall biosynthesis